MKYGGVSITSWSYFTYCTMRYMYIEEYGIGPEEFCLPVQQQGTSAEKEERRPVASQV